MGWIKEYQYVAKDISISILERMHTSLDKYNRSINDMERCLYPYTTRTCTVRVHRYN